MRYANVAAAVNPERLTIITTQTDAPSHQMTMKQCSTINTCGRQQKSEQRYSNVIYLFVFITINAYKLQCCRTY